LEQYLRHTVGGLFAMPRLEPDPTKYHSTQDYVLDRGGVYRSDELTAYELDIVMEAAEAANEVDGEGFEIRQCYGNSARLVFADESGELSYCEGIAQGAVIPVAHAWASINGKVVDLTWRQLEGEGPRWLPTDHPFHNRILGLIPTTRSYRGIGFGEMYLRERIHTTKTFLSLIDDWQGGHTLLREPRLNPPPDYTAMRAAFQGLSSHVP
jgi:hypothetical protein